MIEMTCPYIDALCSAPATFTPDAEGVEGEFIAGDDAVQGILVCAAGHRWRIRLLADDEIAE